MSTPAERLYDHLDHPDGWKEQATEHWRVTDLGSADWVMRKVAKIDQERAAIDDLASQQIETIKAWWTEELERLERTRTHWEWLLADFHSRQLLEDPKHSKTIALPHGKLISRKQPDNIEIAEPSDVLLWALGQANNMVRYPEPELNRSALKEAVLKGGEIIPGVEIVEGEVRYSVLPN